MKEFNNIKTDKDLLKESKILKLIKTGDKEFYKMHWVGWTNAIKIYTSVLKLKDSFEIRQKLFFSLLLRAERSGFFALPGFTDLKNAKGLLPKLIKKVKNLQLYYNFVKRIISSPESFAFNRRELFLLKSDLNKDYKHYLYILFSSRYFDLKEFNENVRNMIKLFPESNFKYFLRDIFIEIDEGLRKYPDFIELLLRKGDRFFNTGNYKKAEEYYLKVLEFKKNVPYALTGLGGIYLHFELYSKALDFYNRSSKIISLYFKNLFGKAVCLSQMGEYQRSIDVLDIMVEHKLPYLGEAYYYKAFNYFLLKEYSKVESDLKNSEKYIPDSLELNTLFGMFYYEVKREKESIKYFNKAVQINPEYPRPYYYLGFLELKKNNLKNGLRNFSLASSFYLKMVKRSLRAISKLKDQDLPRNRLNEIRSKREKRVRLKIREVINKINAVLTTLKNLKRSRKEFLYHTIENLKKLQIKICMGT